MNDYIQKILKIYNRDLTRKDENNAQKKKKTQKQQNQIIFVSKYMYNNEIRKLRRKKEISSCHTMLKGEN